MSHTIRPALPDSIKALIPTLRRCQKLLELGRENDVYAYAWYEEKITKAVQVSHTVNTSETQDRGVVFRIMCNGIHFESASNQIDEASLLECAQSLRARIEEKCGITTEKAFFPTTWFQELETGVSEEIAGQINPHATAEDHIHFAPLCQQDPNEISTADLISRVQAAREKALALAEASHIQYAERSPIADVRLMGRLKLTHNVFIDREKTMSQTLPITVIGGGGITKTGQSMNVIRGGLGTLELTEFSDDDFNNLAVTPQELSTAEKLKPGRYPVITGPGLSGVIAHEAFGHTQEGDTWMKGRSIAKRLHGDKVQVGNAQATIMNNPAVYSMEEADAGSNGSYYFDHEGQLARAQTILDGGYLSTPMTDLSSAFKLKVSRTANGKRESWRRPLMARQTNTYFTPGEHSVADLIGMVKDGFLAVHPHGGMEDPKGGSLTAGSPYFEEIKEGKLTGKKFIGPAGGHIELTDSVFDVLERIQAKSAVSHNDDTPVIKLGGCGKYHKELVDAGVGGPYILWESVNCG